VDDDKIRSKAVRSVRSRVTNLREHLPGAVSTQEFWARLEEKLAQQWELREHTLSETDLAEIHKIRREKYASSAWTFGRNPTFTLQGGRRFPAGKVEVFLEVAQGEVASCAICGDFLGTAPIRGLESAFEGRTFDRETIAAALAGVDTRPYLGEITGEQLLFCVFGRGERHDE